MTQKTRSAVVDRLRPPRELREDTKARRAWLAAAVAEQQAKGLEARVVGKGSYEEVVVRKLEQVEGRAQTRGTCQACGGDVAVMDGRLALHGYERPGWGYAVGRCPGTGLAPAEVSVVFARKVVADCRRQAEEARALMAAAEVELRAAEQWSEYDKAPRWTAPRSSDRRPPKGEAATMADRWHLARREAAGASGHADFIEKLVLPVFGRPVRQVVV